MSHDNVWEKIKKGLKDGAALSMEKIELYTKVGKLKIEEFSAKRKIERNYVDIGERVYELITEDKKDDIANDIFVSNAIENIKSLKVEVEDIEKRVDEASQEESKPKASEVDPETSDDEITGI